MFNDIQYIKVDKNVHTERMNSRLIFSKRIVFVVGVSFPDQYPIQSIMSFSQHFQYLNISSSSELLSWNILISCSNLLE